MRGVGVSCIHGLLVIYAKLTVSVTIIKHVEKGRAPALEDLLASAESLQKLTQRFEALLELHVVENAGLRVRVRIEPNVDDAGAMRNESFVDFDHPRKLASIIPVPSKCVYMRTL
jgi:hypothetical protein